VITRSDPDPSTGRSAWSELSDRVAADVIGRYSTSFTLASRLLSAPVRRDIVNLYAVVRTADEIVDGAAASAGEGPAQVRQLLDGYEDAVTTAGDHGFHTDPVLHAWAGTVRRCGLDMDQMHAFFASMRADLTPTVHDRDSLAAYIHGSAEVIGLLCLDIFLTHGGTTGADRDRLADGAAALGAAFQKINFLRDVGEDVTLLHRAYLPGDLTEETKDRLLDDAAADLARGSSRVADLPAGSRAGVAAAAALYGDLLDRLRATPAADLVGPGARRVRVPAARKLWLTAKAVTRG
jgi:phytoene synthase